MAGRGRCAVSVEEGLAETLKLKLGDRLRFDIAGQMPAKAASPACARSTGVRCASTSSCMFPLARMARPAAAATSAPSARPAQPGFDNALARDFPNITSIDVSASIAQVQRVLDQVIRAVEFLFGFTLAAGLVVLFAAVTATREARAREFAIMRALGAGSRLLAQVQRAELLGVGALAGLLASLAAVAVGWLLARYVFEFSWNPSPWVPLVGTRGRRAAGAGRRLVGPARSAAPAGAGDAAPRHVTRCRRRRRVRRFPSRLGCRQRQRPMTNAAHRWAARRPVPAWRPVSAAGSGSWPAARTRATAAWATTLAGAAGAAGRAAGDVSGGGRRCVRRPELKALDHVRQARSLFAQALGRPRHLLPPARRSAASCGRAR